jgi:hypothetical protein
MKEVATAPSAAKQKMVAIAWLKIKVAYQGYGKTGVHN